MVLRREIEEHLTKKILHKKSVEKQLLEQRLLRFLKELKFGKLGFTRGISGIEGIEIMEFKFVGRKELEVGNSRKTLGKTMLRRLSLGTSILMFRKSFKLEIENRFEDMAS